MSVLIMIMIIMRLSRRYISKDVVRAKNVVLHVWIYAHYSLDAHMDNHLEGKHNLLQCLSARQNVHD